MNFFYNLNIYSDAPQPWGLYFQDSASPQMEALIELHDNVMFYLAIILFGVAWIMVSIIRNYVSKKSPISNKYLNHGTLIELIWTITPALILILIAFPSFKLLYLMDEVTDPSLTVFVEGHQWYWSYQYPDFSNGDDEELEFDSYLVPESDLEGGVLTMEDRMYILPAFFSISYIKNKLIIDITLEKYNSFFSGYSFLEVLSIKPIRGMGFSIINFSTIPLPLSSTAHITNMKVLFTTFLPNIEYNMYLWNNNLMPFFSHYWLMFSYIKLFFGAIGFYSFVLKFSGSTLYNMHNIFRTIIVWCRTITTIALVLIRNTRNFIFDNSFLSFLFMLFFFFVLLILILSLGGYFDFSHSISQYTGTALNTIWIIIATISAFIDLIFGILSDYFMHRTYVIENWPLPSSTSSLTLLYRIGLNFMAFIWIISGIFYTNSLYNLINHNPPFTTLFFNHCFYFVIGIIGAIGFTASWDFLSVYSLWDNILLTCIARVVLDSLGFLSIVTSTFGSWAMYYNDLFGSGFLSRILVIPVSFLLYMPFGYLMQVQFLVRLMPRLDPNYIPRAPRVFLGNLIFWFNGLSPNSQEHVNNTGRPLFRQSVYFSVLWNVTWTILVFITNPIIILWTNHVTSSSSNNSLINAFILLLSMVLSISLTPNYYFFFTDVDNVTTLTLLLESIRFFFYVLGYIMFAAVGYNPFWP